MPAASQVVRQLASEEEGARSKAANIRANVPVSGKPRTVFDYFPGSSYRAGQHEAMQQIADAFINGTRRYVVAELPTGVGKSFIAMAFARYYETAHILTVQKVLQTQYEQAFDKIQAHVFSMRGRSAYVCSSDSTKTCAAGPCRLNKKVKHSDCPYRVALLEAHSSPITVHNFDSFYYQNKVMPYSARQLLVIDEAHALENKYLGYMSFSLSNRIQKDLVIPEYKLAEQYVDFIKQHKAELDDVIAKMEQQDVLTQEQSAWLNEHSELSMKLGVFLSKVSSVEYVVDYFDKVEYQMVTLRPVFVGSYIADTLFTKGERVLMLSATIINKQIFCDSIGLKPDDVEFIQIDSSFPAENRPIIRKYAGLMSYDHIDKTLPISVELVKKILAKFPNHRGIIHTHSERIANYLRSELHDSRLTFRKDYTTVEGMLEAHQMKPNSFIVASGLREGIDLHDELSRVQIIMKVPFPDLSDKRTKRKKELNPSWYGIQTVLLFVQSIGRSVRSEHDKAITYILDESFEMFYRVNKRYIPNYIREAIR